MVSLLCSSEISFSPISLILFRINFIKKFIDSETFLPVLADVRKHPQKSEFFANSNRFSYPSFWSSKRSTLFSTKIHGIFPPSINVSDSSIAFFQLRDLDLNIIK